MANDPMQVSVSSEVLNWLHGMYDDDFVGKVLRSGEHSVEDGGVLLIKVGKTKVRLAPGAWTVAVEPEKRQPVTVFR